MMLPSPDTLSRDTYARAEQFLPWNLAKLVTAGELKPVWLEGQDRFWYVRKGPAGKAFILVDPATATRTPAFDHCTVASALSAASGKPCTREQLPFDAFEFHGESAHLRFTAHGKHWEFDPASASCTYLGECSPPDPAERLSPDKRWAVSVHEHNLHLRDTRTGEVSALTFDGILHHDYGSTPECNLEFISHKLDRVTSPPAVLWSPDSRRLLVQRLDQRRVKELHLLQSVPSEGQRPVLHTYRYAMAGDEHLVGVTLLSIDLETRTVVAADLPQHETDFLGPVESKYLWWGEEAEKYYYLLFTRGSKRVSLWEVEAATGTARRVHEECSETYVEVCPMELGRPNVRILRDGSFIWPSEREGWAHLYRHDLRTGILSNPITRGTMVVHEITHVDEKRGWVYLTASGREEGRDPYYRHLYRAKLDGSDLQLLTPEDADHSVTFSDSGRCFVDRHSRIDHPPVGVLRSADGALILKLEEADTGLLEGLGWRSPEPFSVKAADGVTDLHGTVFRPSDFDPAVSYPVIEAVYPGPQVNRVQKSFLPFDIAHSMAELGFIVVTLDGRGNCGRSKAFHDHSHGRFSDAGSLQDHICALRQLAIRHPCMDLDRVGIYGHSGGGFASAKALLLHPEFYKVAVSSAGNHDQRGYLAEWGEMYGLFAREGEPTEQANTSLASRLQGKLLLIHGDMDDNVHPALTMQLVDALIKANKDFDLLILPNRNHLCNLDPYLLRKRWDYFVRHLQGKEPPSGYAIDPAPVPVEYA